MTINDAIIKCVTTCDFKLAGQIVDTLRARYGMNWGQIWQTVNAVQPIEQEDWDDLLYEYDLWEGRQ